MGDQLRDLLEHETFGDKVRRITQGLRAAKDSGEYRYAVFSLVQIVGPATFSVFFSVLLVVMALTVKTGHGTGMKDITVEVTMIEPETVKIDDVKIEEEDKPEIVEAVKPPVVDENTPVVPGAPSEYSSGGDAPGDGAGSSEAGAGADGSGEDNSLVPFAPAITKSPLVLRGIYGNRSGPGRGKALKQYAEGFGNQTEFAVKKALEWLKRHQYPDGSWGPYYRTSMTGLALLAFLAHGENTSSPEYGESIRRGLRYMLKSQQNGMFLAGGPGHGPQVNSYEHAIATYAISEAYGLTSIPALKVAMEDAVQVIIDGQNEEGSWDYGYKKGPESNVDVSLAGWHIQALKSASAAGAENKGLKTAIDNSMRGLKIMIDKKKGSGLFQYSTRTKDAEATFPITGVAVLCMQLCGHVIDPEARSGINAIKDLGFRWTKGDTAAQDQRGMGEWPIYGWYYITQARFQQGGKTWSTWNKQFAPALCNMQNKDGSWCPAPNSTEGSYGPVYCTALSTLMLEVYYRFLPTYQPIEAEKGPAPEKGQDKEEEITIKFG